MIRSLKLWLHRAFGPLSPAEVLEAALVEARIAKAAAEAEVIYWQHVVRDLSTQIELLP
jgi:hypothetical protein